MPTEDDESWEINPGSHENDPDFSEESWDNMSIGDYIIAIGNYGNDLDSVADVISNMPDHIFEEYAEMGFPELPEEMHPDYEKSEEEEIEPEEEEEDEEEKEEEI